MAALVKVCPRGDVVSLVQYLSVISNEFNSISPEMEAKREKSFCIIEYAKRLSVISVQFSFRRQYRKNAL